MDNKIEIIEKPEWVSWDDIHNVLWKAHEQNRQKGVVMRLSMMPAEELEKFIGDAGKMFIAMDGSTVIGTLTIFIRKGGTWFERGQYGFLCLVAVLPEYSGKGVYRALIDSVESEARCLGVRVLVHVTHENNKRMLKISRQAGCHYLSYKKCEDHFNIVLAKWLDECPFPVWYIKLRFLISRLKNRIRYKSGPGGEIVFRFPFLH